MNRLLVRAFALVAVTFGVASRIEAGISVVTFEDQGVGSNSYKNAANPAPDGTPAPFETSGFFTSKGISFYNVNGKVGPYPYWSGFAISSTTDTINNKFENQYSAITGSGADGSSTYAVAAVYGSDAYINLAAGSSLVSMDVTNTTYGALTMEGGDPYAYTTPFSRDLQSFFLLTIKGYGGLDLSGGLVATKQIYLANFQNTNPLDDFILKGWETINFGADFAGVSSLGFQLTSSDNGDFGMNTPAYFALDNLVFSTPTSAVPEPASLSLCLLGFGVAGVAVIRKRSAA